MQLFKPMTQNRKKTLSNVIYCFDKSLLRYLLSVILIKSAMQTLHGNICLGEQSFKHGDVLSEKNNFSTPGGPKSTIFDTDDVDPLYFEVSIVSAPPYHPY